MAENQNELQIVLELVDKATGELKKTLNEVKKETEGVKKSSDEASDSMQEGFKKSGKELKDLRQAMFGVVAVIATIIATTKEWAKSNLATKEAYDSLGDNVRKITGLIGSMFAPTISALSKALEASMVYIEGFFKGLQNIYLGFFKAVQFAMQFVIAFTSALGAGANVMDAFKIATEQAKSTVADLAEEFQKSFEQNIPQLDEEKRKIQEFNEQLNNVKLSYIAGSISAQEYYAMTSALMDSDIAKRQESISLMTQERELERLATDQAYGRTVVNQSLMASQKQMYQERAMLENQDLLNQKINADALTNLLKTVQSKQITLWGTIFNFINTGIKGFLTNFSAALSSIMLGTKSAKEAFKEFGQKMLEVIVDFVAQLAAQAIISLTIGRFIAASVSSTASTIAGAWLPAALFASVATLGAADAAGVAGLAAAGASALGIMAGMQAASAGMSASTDVIQVTKSASELSGAADGGAKAQGGEGIVSRPTMFLAGEAGPEYYNFTPMSKMGRSSGGNVVVNIEINNPMVRTDNDIDELTEKISTRLAQEIERI